LPLVVVLAGATPARAEPSEAPTDATATRDAVARASAARRQYAIDRDPAAVRAAIERLEELEWSALHEEREPDAEIAAELEACRALLHSPTPAPAPAPAPAGPAIDVPTADLIRATIAADPQLSKRWRRGSVLFGFGIPVTIVGAGMFVGGAVLGIVNVVDQNFDGSGLGLFLGGFAAMGAGGTMIGFGVRDRAVAKRDARRRLQMSLLPRRGGASFGVALRF
jgi:hypothetical protein